MDTIMYDFFNSDYADDFEALVDVHNFFDWVPEGKFDIWMKAYDTSCRETAREIELNDNGYKFDCYVWVCDLYGFQITTDIQPRAARTREEAEEILIKMADSLVKSRYVIDTLKQLIEQ